MDDVVRISDPRQTETTPAKGDDFFARAPTLSLPKGGGAIRGIGEKFAANPVTGTGSMSVPIYTSPGRSGFGPTLALTYDSGAGNGPFGFGWSLSLPSISRKTDKGLPRYFDADESDVFLISGAEDLVPVIDTTTRKRFEDRTTVPGYTIHRYVPRIEGLFARIERWTRDDGSVHWRTISKDNVTALYGLDEFSRIRDPLLPFGVFSWLICRSYDDKGNAIAYTYRKEDGGGIDLSQPQEANRGERNDARRTVNRYLDRVQYGNVSPYFATSLGRRPVSKSWPNQWMFELVFEYEGEQRRTGYVQDTATQREFYQDATLLSASPWTARKDAFSSYRAGFEVRTSRRCSRTLMFHHFQAELGRPDYLVRSTDFSYEYGLEQPTSAVASYLSTVTQRAYEIWDAGAQKGFYYTRALPPVEFTYTEAMIDPTVHELDSTSLENLPNGLDGARYLWVDLDGEGAAGILTEQGGALHYKRNLSPLNANTDDRPVTNTQGAVLAQFAALELVTSLPSLTQLSGGRQQLLDLTGDGELDLVTFERPTPGFFERGLDEGWMPFVPFQARPELPWSSPNLRFVDLTGDGRADIFITEDDAFSWHASLGKWGFAPAVRVQQALNEELGPRLVFADGTETIFLADLTGDGLTDLARIRNGEVCYWPNLGYGRFGAKVTMGGSPWFDYPDRFDPRRIRLADIDGSGATDIIYLHPDEARIYSNLAGNAWHDARPLPTFPRVDNVANVQVVDLLGNGTACIVWSSPLPDDAASALRYIDLMGGQKPHLLTKIVNNLGAETDIHYAPSTYFYQRDKLLGTPWATRLPFPVHCVERVTVRDTWQSTEFSTTYSYHHGHFDGIEREFRGFGRYEQVDTQSYGKVAAANADSPFMTKDQTLWQPPVKSITWIHTGIVVDRTRILGLYEQEYFPKRFSTQLTQATFVEKDLPQPVIDPASGPDLDADEWREAMRACKGMVLRQEVYELDLAALHDRGEQQPVRLYSAAQHNCRIRRLQAREDNRHAVFVVVESEAVSYQYELAIPDSIQNLTPDPRIAHTLNLRFDAYGRTQQSVAVVHPRQIPVTDDAPLTTIDPALTAPQIGLIHAVQNERHMAYTETHFSAEPAQTDLQIQDNHRLPAPCEVLTYELTGDDPTTGFVPSSKPYFSVDDLIAFKLSDIPSWQGTKAVGFVDYQAQPADKSAHKRRIEWARTLYFLDDLTGAQSFGNSNWLSLPYESYKLALTDGLLSGVFATPASGAVPADDKLQWLVATGVKALDALKDPAASGYIPGTQIDASLTGQYWMRSGIAGFSANAPQHFYLPEKYTDPFNHMTMFDFDDVYHLYAKSSTDARFNKSEVVTFDYRVLAPIEITDPNGNHATACCDVFGRVIATAMQGKKVNNQWEGDNLSRFDAALRNPPVSAVQAFCTSPSLNMTTARTWLDDASARMVYHFGEKRSTAGALLQWADRMAGACTVLREIHAAAPGGATSRLQAALECSDGAGNVLMKKTQAEPDPAGTAAPALRWIVNGLTVLNNKGKPVLQYEPTFSAKFGCELPQANGVASIIYYDAAGRLVRTEMPDGSFSRVEVSPWLIRNYDANDTVLESRWYRERLTAAERGVPLNDPAAAPDVVARAQAEDTLAAGADPQDKRAATLAVKHANTPAEIHLDSLGREVIAITWNRTPVGDPAHTNDASVATWNWKGERNLTFTKLDAQGKPLWIRDARGNLVMQYITPAKADNEPDNGMPGGAVPCYDIAGNLLFQHSMDAGERWTIHDAAGKTLLAWDANEFAKTGAKPALQKRLYHTEYDALHRPLNQWLKVDSDAPRLIEAFNYIDTGNFTDANGNVTDASGLQSAGTLNLIGQAVEHWDPSGRATVKRIDLCGKPAHITRTLVTVDTTQDDVPALGWPAAAADRQALLDKDTFIQLSEFDALGRMTTLYNWHRDITFAGGPTSTPGATDRVAVYVPQYNERGVLKSEALYVRAKKQTTNGKTAFAAGNISSVNAIANLTYDAKGRKKTLALGNGTITRYTYDDQNFRLTSLFTRRPGAVPGGDSGSNTANDPRPKRPCGMQNLNYTYDPVGNITHIQDDAQDSVYFGNKFIEPSNDYVYDALYRLIEGTGRENPANPSPPNSRLESWPSDNFPSDLIPRNYTQRFVYDEVGNFTTMNHLAGTGIGWTRNYLTKPANNRLDRTWYGSTTGDAVTYYHDTHGNLLNLNRIAPPSADPGERWGLAIRWDWRDMICRFDGGGGGVARYQYGIDKQRTRKQITRSGGVVEERIYLGGYELYRRSSAQGVVEEIESHHLFEGEQRILLVDDVITSSKGTQDPRPDGLVAKTQTLFRYQYGNHLGSACLELDDKAEIISYEEYHPYGTSAYRAMKNGIEAPPKRYRYTGMERDEESGLGYHSGRYCAYWLGQWLSTDPKSMVDGLNLYCYAGCEPIGRRDPTGTQSTSANQSTAPVLSGTLNQYWRLPTEGGYIREHWAPTATVQQPIESALRPYFSPPDLKRFLSSIRNNTQTSRLRADVAQAKTLFDNARSAKAKLPGYDQTSEYLQTVEDTQGVFRAAGATPQETASVPSLTAASYEASIVGEAAGVRVGKLGQALPKQVAPLLRQPVAPATNATAPVPVNVVKFPKSTSPVKPAQLAAVEQPLTSTAGSSAPVVNAKAAGQTGAAANTFKAAISGISEALNKTMLGISLFDLPFQYIDFSKFLTDVKEKGWGSFGGDLYGTEDKVLEGLNSQPPNTTVDVHYPGGRVRRVTTSVYGTFFPLD
jgi:RHS repeat-associated protein